MQISRQGETDRIELTLPLHAGGTTILRRGDFANRGRSEARERYLNSVSGDLAPSREIVLLELAIDYDATLRMEDADADAITLVMDLPLEGLSH